MDWNRTLIPIRTSFHLAIPCHHTHSIPRNHIPFNLTIIHSITLWYTTRHLTPNFVSIRPIYNYTGRTTVAVPKPTHQPITSRVVSQVTSSSCGPHSPAFLLCLASYWLHFRMSARSKASTAHLPIPPFVINKLEAKLPMLCVCFISLWFLCFWLFVFCCFLAPDSVFIYLFYARLIAPLV